MIGSVLFILLSLDLAGFAHGDLSSNATAVIAVVLAVVEFIVLLVTYLNGRAAP